MKLCETGYAPTRRCSSRSLAKALADLQALAAESMGWQPLGEGQVCRICGGPNQGKGARLFSCGTRRVGPLHGKRHRGAANTGCNSVLSAHGIALLNAHPQPWFVDQIAIFRLIEEGLTPAKCVHLELL